MLEFLILSRSEHTLFSDPAVCRLFQEFSPPPPPFGTSYQPAFHRPAYGFFLRALDTITAVAACDFSTYPEFIQLSEKERKIFALSELGQSTLFPVWAEEDK